MAAVPRGTVPPVPVAGRGVRAHPLGVALLLVGAALSVATDPVPADESWIATRAVSGVVELDGSEPATVTLRLTMSCARPEDGSGDFPLDAQVTIEALVTPLDDGPDSAARTHVVGTSRIGEDAIGEDDEYLDADPERLAFGVGALGDRCEDAAACELDVSFDFQADAAVRIEWTATADGSWYRDVSGPCLLFLFEV